ncbi:MAG: heavy metal-binding domain-containing protein [Planctomycetota bacterium]
MRGFMVPWLSAAMLCGLLVGGCGEPARVETPITHPANPAAASAPVEPRSNTLQIAPTPSSQTDGGAQSGPPLQPVPHEPAGETPATAGAATTYTCPMHPQIHSKVPGKCPICGMTLVPEKHDGDAK